MRTPGVEPGLAGWEPAVITTRPCPLMQIGKGRGNLAPRYELWPRIRLALLRAWSLPSLLISMISVFSRFVGLRW